MGKFNGQNSRPIRNSASSKERGLGRPKQVQPTLQPSLPTKLILPQNSNRYNTRGNKRKQKATKKYNNSHINHFTNMEPHNQTNSSFQFNKVFKNDSNIHSSNNLVLDQAQFSSKESYMQHSNSILTVPQPTDLLVNNSHPSSHFQRPTLRTGNKRHLSQTSPNAHKYQKNLITTKKLKAV